MFDLEKSIADWRRQMLATGIKAPAPFEELEAHLHEEIEREIQSGASPQRAFTLAADHVGQAASLKTEFKKIERENWNRPLACTAWVLFVVSFFLPAYGTGFGWQCAGLSATAVSWPEFRQNGMTVLLVSLTPANLLMSAAPFLLLRFSRNAALLKCLRFSVFGAWLLVWSFLWLFEINCTADGEGLKFGCLAWGISFPLLWLSLLKRRTHKTPSLQHV